MRDNFIGFDSGFMIDLSQIEMIEPMNAYTCRVYFRSGNSATVKGSAKNLHKHHKHWVSMEHHAEGPDKEQK
jgi:hypothetical protein